MYFIKFSISSLLISIILSITSCSGDDGEQGPAGPAGRDGTANITSETFTTSNSDWDFDSQFNTYEARFSVPSITQDVTEKGTVQMFIEEQGDFVGLPFVFNIIQWNYGFEIGSATVLVSLADGSVPNNPGGVTFKVVVIPPANFIEVDHTNYQMVEEVYGLDLKTVD